jgi:Zinc carboxypeptidase/Penicillin-insensitive murein endopeptidase
VLSRIALILAAGAATLAAVSVPSAADEPIQWQSSRSLGVPWDGRLVRGVRLPAEGEHFFTWDPVQKRSPNRHWRRWGSDRLIRVLLRVIDEYAAAHPDASRVGVGDLSRPNGGVFDERFGGRGHASHQNGLDVDVYYPRLDGQELRPARPAQVDRVLAQELVTRFVQAGAVKVFVGPRLGLRGPRQIVQRLIYHDDHMHVRIGPDPDRRLRIGRSARRRPIMAVRAGDVTSERKALVVGCIHGNECAGTAVTRILARSSPAVDLWVVSNLNPDGFALDRRQNARGVDLNRNFPSEWRAGGRPGDPEYPGPRPLSEPETRAAARLIQRLRPSVTIWFHQPQGLVRAWGQSRPAAREYARLAGMRFRAIRWPRGTAPNWQNHRFPGTSSFVVELPAGPLTPAAANRHARAVLALVESEP